MAVCKGLSYKVLLYLLINECSAVIYHLNESEYERMPPLFGLDRYEPCLLQPNGVYCMMELDLYGAPDNQLISVIKEYSEHTVKHYNHTYIQRGVCVQKTCQESLRNKTGTTNRVVLTGILEECLNDSIYNEYGVGAKMKCLHYCDSSDDLNHKDISDWIVAAIFLAILIVNVLGSLYDVFLNDKNRPKGNKYLLSFSLLRNWQWLTSSDSTDPRMERLKGLHGYRTIAIILMMIAHVIWVNSLGFTENSHEFEKAYESISYQVIFNGMMIIQLFLVQSGFLLAYNLLVREETQTISWKMYPKLLLMRWWRLTPPYAAVLAFTATWLRHSGSGPLWRLWAADSVAGDCRRHWWLHLLYVNNYVRADKFCAIQSWYLGAEMQVFAVCLFLFLVASPRARGLVLASLLVLGSVIPALHVYFQDLHGIMVMEPEFYRQSVSKTFDIHVLGHNYLASYAIGMGAACLLYRLQKKGIDKNRNKILQVLSWCVFPAMVSLFLGGRVFYTDGARALLATRAVWAAAHRLIMGGIVAFAILSLAMRFSESHCAVFECPAWLVPARLSYCVYLVHMNYIHSLVASRAHLTQVSFFYMIIAYFGVVVVSFLTALPLYMLVEAPAARLLKTFTTR